MNFLACGPGRPVVSRMKGTRLMCGYLSNLFFSTLLAISPGFVLAAQTRDGLQEKKATMDTSIFVTEPSRSKSRYLLLNEHLGATLRFNDVSKASPNNCMPAINTSSISTAVAVMLFGVHWFVADDTRRTVVRARLYHIYSVGSRRMRGHQSPGY